MFRSGMCPRTTCGGMEGTDFASVPHPLIKKLLNDHNIILVFQISQGGENLSRGRNI
ncbi:hypothetical protein ZWY2020_056914 [Hordeum vulgare]|nr:hypothetical protein ZWY2020_056914 [Hordeum vulgare]